MKFSFIEPHLKISGGIRRIVELSNQLVKRGHKVTIYHPSGEKCQWLKCLAGTKKLKHIARDDHEILVYNYPRQNQIFSSVSARLKLYYILHANHLIYGKDLILPTYRQPHVLKVACSKWVEESVRKYIGHRLPVLYAGINREIFIRFRGVKKKWM